MHGQRKRFLTEEELELKRGKIRTYEGIVEKVQSLREQQVRSEEALQGTRHALRINPEWYSLWNYRREILPSLWEQHGKEKLCEEELTLVAEALRRNPKSYCAWHHRCWVIEQGVCDLDRELQLCNEFLKLDSRNFHCWDYRRFIVKCKKHPDSEELLYTQKLIASDFSNYSAWHYRSKLIEKMFPVGSPELEEQLLKEFKLVENAFFTEPDDQSAWLYHRWLLGKSTSVMTGATNLETHQDEHALHVRQERDESKASAELVTLERELAMCEELLEVEPDCKWALLTCAVLHHAMDRLLRPRPDFQQKVNWFFSRLLELDPMRKGYYEAVQRSLNNASA